MIPTPDLALEYLAGILGFIVIASGIGIGLWKWESDSSTVFAYVGMFFGFLLIIGVGLNGAVGLGDWTEGKVDLWRDEITNEIQNTECEYLESLSNDYENSSIDRYTVKQIKAEIESEYIYKCVETRDYVFNGERKGVS